MPHHWSDAKDKDVKQDAGDGRQAGPDFEARAWATGQVVTAQAALKLLAHRAGNELSPWPEFAELDCFACHHSLQGKSWRQQRARQQDGKRAAGSYPWGTWYFSMPPILARIHKERISLSALDDLAREMSKPIPHKGKVVKKAQEAEREMRLLLDGLQRSERSGTKEVARLFSLLARDPEQLADAGWDSAAQVYLGLAAAHNAWKDLGQPPAALAPILKEMAEVLRFPKGQGSPGPGFTPQAFREKLLSLRKVVSGE